MSKTFPEKWLKKLNASADNFVESAESANSDELKKIIIECEQKIVNIEDKKSQDDKLNAAKDLVKEYSAAYRDAAAYETAKIKYCLFVLEGRGVNLGDEEEVVEE